MKLLKQLSVFLVAICTCILLTSAVGGPVERSTQEVVTPTEVTQTAQKEVNPLEGLSKKEARAYKRIQKKLKKAKARADKKNDGDKSWTVTLVLAILVGGLGIHRFYLGYTVIGIIQLLTLGGLGIWWLIDLIRIITRDLQPKDGSYSD